VLRLQGVTNGSLRGERVLRERASSGGWRAYLQVVEDPSFFRATRTLAGAPAPRLRLAGLTPRPRHLPSGSQLPFEFSGRSARAGAMALASYRSIWLSDFHLGTPRCQAEILLDFLRHHQAQRLYLVGDIVDGWNCGRSWCFSDAQKAVAKEIATWRKRGTCVEFLPGNHDHSSLDLVETLLGLVPRRTELIHRTADGRRMLVTHGHQFDRATTSGRWLKGTQAYTMALRIHHWYAQEWTHRCRQPRSMSAYLRHRVKQAIQYLTAFDDRAVFEAVRRERADGLICGHVHRAEQRLIGPIWYINDGDWVENCTALVEDHAGALRLMRWGASSPDSAEAGARTDEAESYVR
jgi:UDP-2,3-diacylglucosamine pyrophosphatase LpxH